jgi:thymidylate kinase
MKIILEGPDKTGKTTLAMAMADTEGGTFLHLPAEPVRSLVLNEDFSGAASTFALFADSISLWDNPPENFVLDRDILSMLAYQGFLLGNINPIIILNLYKSVVYRDHKPDKIIYLVNEPFEDYDNEDPFEQYGYEAIRTAYEQAVSLFELNFPEIELQRLNNERI